MLGQYGPQLFVAPLSERRTRTLPLVLRLTILERVPYLVLALATLLLIGRSAGLLLAVFFLMLFLALLGSGLCTPPWLDMVARSVPRTWIGRFFGLWSGVGGLLGVGGAAVAAAIIARVEPPYSFALCFVLTFAAMVVSFVLLSQGREVQPLRWAHGTLLGPRPAADQHHGSGARAAVASVLREALAALACGVARAGWRTLGVAARG